MHGNALAPQRLTVSTARRLTEYSWPGNVRELKNAIEATDLDVLDRSVPSPSQSDLLDADLPSAAAKLEKAMIQNALEACSGNQTEAAPRWSAIRPPRGERSRILSHQLTGEGSVIDRGRGAGVQSNFFHDRLSEAHLAAPSYSRPYSTGCRTSSGLDGIRLDLERRHGGRLAAGPL
jgi:Bacterial regulatory protein, Fis family